MMHTTTIPYAAATPRASAMPIDAIDPARNPVPPFDLVLFGATGDLAGRKLFPALLQREIEGVLPEGAAIIGVGRGAMEDDAFRAQLATRIGDGRDRATLDAFLRKVRYVALDVERPDSFAALGPLLTDQDRVRAFYLSVAPAHYAATCEALAAHGLVTPSARIVVEKPIGHDLRSAVTIMDAVGRAFTEAQTYRIDHYLGKETVQNLLVLRFANTIFERLWSNADVDHVQITVAEEVGLEARAGYYQTAGALRDMVQNHLLQLLCLFAMEPPNTLDADAVRDEKVRILKALRPISESEVLQRTVRGQYRSGFVAGRQVRSYEEELGRESAVETFAALRVEIDTWRWAGVPIFLRTGKRMMGRFSEIVVTFKPVPHSIFAPLGADGTLQPNRLVIRLQPDDGVQLVTMAKIPGSGRLRLRETGLDLRFGEAFENRSPDAYERLLTDVLRGQQTLFMRRDEVEAAWRFIDPIARGWADRYPLPHRYTAGTNGPAQAVGLIEREGRSWLEHAGG
jgi:glucose-6-phosphate 1-dehydrogenase